MSNQRRVAVSTSCARSRWNSHLELPVMGSRHVLARFRFEAHCHRVCSLTRNAHTGPVSPRHLPRYSWHFLTAKNEGENAHWDLTQRICAWRSAHFLSLIERVTTHNIGGVFPNHGNEVVMITCDSSSQSKRKRIRCIGRIETVHSSPRAAHGTLLGTLHTDVANRTTRCGLVGRIYTPLHYPLRRVADFEQRGRITIIVSTLGHEVDDTLTIIYEVVNDAWNGCIMTFHSELTATPSKRKRFIIIRALASRTPVLASGYKGYISPGIEAAESVQVDSELVSIAFWIIPSDNGEVVRR